jgi:hypothetical protein
MKIYFSQSYDSPVKTTKSLFNETVLGPIGLLRILERALGIIPSELSPMERNNAYREALDE